MIPESGETESLQAPQLMPQRLLPVTLLPIALYERSNLKDFLTTILDRVELGPRPLPCSCATASRCVVGLVWRPQGDSNPRYRRERAMS
jgi:hypothetical protein